MKEHNKAICMNCGENLDSSTSLQDESNIPEVGDFCICFYCGDIATYVQDLETKNMFIISVEPEQLKELEQEHEEVYNLLVKAQNHILNNKK